MSGQDVTEISIAGGKARIQPEGSLDVAARLGVSALSIGDGPKCRPGLGRRIDFHGAPVVARGLGAVTRGIERSGQLLIAPGAVGKDLGDPPPGGGGLAISSQIVESETKRVLVLPEVRPQCESTTKLRQSFFGPPIALEQLSQQPMRLVRPLLQTGHAAQFLHGLVDLSRLAEVLGQGQANLDLLWGQREGTVEGLSSSLRETRFLGLHVLGPTSLGEAGFGQRELRLDVQRVLEAQERPIDVPCDIGAIQQLARFPVLGEGGLAGGHGPLDPLEVLRGDSASFHRLGNGLRHLQL